MNPQLAKRLIVALYAAKNRVSVLKGRLADVKTEHRRQDYNGYMAGINSPDALSEITNRFELGELGEFDAFLCDTFADNSAEMNIFYHLENVSFVINNYYQGIGNCWNANDMVLEEDINGCEMVEGVIESVIDALKRTCCPSEAKKM